MGEADDVELAGRGEGLEQVARGDAVRCGGRAVLDQRVRRAADDAVLLGEEDVAVAAERRVAGPLIAGQRDETARLVELAP